MLVKKMKKKNVCLIYTLYFFLNTKKCSLSITIFQNFLCNILVATKFWQYFFLHKNILRKFQQCFGRETYFDI